MPKIRKTCKCLLTKGYIEEQNCRNCGLPVEGGIMENLKGKSKKRLYLQTGMIFEAETEEDFSKHFQEAQEMLNHTETDIDGMDSTMVGIRIIDLDSGNSLFEGGRFY